MNGFTEIPELSQLQSGHALIRVPMEQNVPFTNRVKAIVDTEAFQRLSEISQLGLVAKVYPGARHTRFEHVLGVYHNALRYLQQLSNDPRFGDIVSPHQAEVLIAAALLHDLGHWPFCHPIEDLGLAEMPPHEAHADRFLGEGTEIAEVLRRDWGIEPAEVLEILVPQTPSQSLDLLRSILSGPIDVDKMDYLDRDSLHCGVPYGRNFDRQRLIQSLVVNASGDGLAITDKGKTAAELMVFARYVMFSEVYWHHAVRSATSMFARAFYDLHQEFDWTELFCMTDAEMIAALRLAAEGTPCQKLLDGVFGRRRGLFKRAAEYSHEHAPRIYNLIAGRPYDEIAALSRALVDEVNSRTQRNLLVTDLLIDAPPPHREVEFAIDIYFPKQQRFRALREVSPVVDALARTQFDEWVKQVRIFIAPDQRDIAAGLNWDETILAACSRVG